MQRPSADEPAFGEDDYKNGAGVVVHSGSSGLSAAQLLHMLVYANMMKGLDAVSPDYAEKCADHAVKHYFKT
jgi:hypothetical protein